MSKFTYEEVEKCFDVSSLGLAGDIDPATDDSLMKIRNAIIKVEAEEKAALENTMRLGFTKRGIVLQGSCFYLVAPL